MIDFKEFLETLQAEAILNKLNPTEETIWYSIARSYSQKFSTPLKEVLEMDPAHVISQHYGAQLDDVDAEENAEKLLELVNTIKNPNYEKEKNGDLEDFVKQAEEEEKQRIKKGAPVPTTTKKSLLDNNVKDQEKQPTGGRLDLSHLQDDEHMSLGFKE